MIGIIDDPNGYPVRQDDNGTPAEYKDGPYLLDDGVSFEAPIPVVIVTDDFYRDSAGNLRGVWPMNITGLTTGPINITPPALNTDIAYVGTVLTVSNGTWDGVAPITYSYQWQDTNGPVFVDILGENTSTYTTNTGDIGYRVRCEVIATDANGSTRAVSNITYAVTAGVGPANTVAPFLQGTIQVGATIACNYGTWTGTEPINYTYQWRRNGVNIAGATSHIYQIVADDATTNLSCVVTATNVVGAVSAVSNTQLVPAEVPVNVVPPLVIGGATVGLTLTSDYGQWEGSPAPDLFINWQVSDNGVTGWTEISGANSDTLTVTGAYMGKYLRTLVTAVNVGGNTNIASNVSGPVV